MTSESSASGNVDRRTFLATASVGAGVMFIKPQLVFGTEANSAVRVGLLGCGGRGSEDASNLVDAGARVVALADLFQDQLDAARNHFDQLQQPKGYSARISLLVPELTNRYPLQKKLMRSSSQRLLIITRNISRPS